mmetsp:Transcript_1020/g.2818  ORF Transcript_1020/g.2818 Transcript_1020/m.2818 type:complete len:235 (+) Transcript_1020:2231-2935(+)
MYSTLSPSWSATAPEAVSSTKPRPRRTPEARRANISARRSPRLRLPNTARAAPDAAPSGDGSWWKPRRRRPRRTIVDMTPSCCSMSAFSCTRSSVSRCSSSRRRRLLPENWLGVVMMSASGKEMYVPDFRAALAGAAASSRGCGLVAAVGLTAAAAVVGPWMRSSPTYMAWTPVLAKLLPTGAPSTRRGKRKARASPKARRRLHTSFGVTSMARCVRRMAAEGQWCCAPGESVL